MNCEHAEGLIADRLKGHLTNDEQSALDGHLAACTGCREAAEAYGALWRDMAALDREPPHERMRARFYAAVAAHDRRYARLDRALEHVWPRRPAFQAALAAGLLVAGIVAGIVVERLAPSPLETEIATLRRDVNAMSLALLDHQSASERLLGVAWSRRTAAEEPVSRALLDAVRNDSNVNVRLAAVEALSGRLGTPEVGAALTAALGREQAPLVQVTLAEALLEGGVDGSVQAVRRLVDREDVDPAVRDHLRAVLDEIDEAVPGAELL